MCMWLRAFGIGEYFAIGLYRTWADRVCTFRHVIFMSDPSGMHQLKEYFAVFLMNPCCYFFPSFNLLVRINAWNSWISKRFGSWSCSFCTGKSGPATRAVLFDKRI